MNQKDIKRKKVETEVEIWRMDVEESESIQQEPKKEREEKKITCMKNLNE